jgi:hypothetical protein
VLDRTYKLCSLVWVLVGLLLVLVVSIISLDYCVELYILICSGQNWTDIGPVSIWTWFHPLVECIRKNILHMNFVALSGSCFGCYWSWLPGSFP